MNANEAIVSLATKVAAGKTDFCERVDLKDYPEEHQALHETGANTAILSHKVGWHKPNQVSVSLYLGTMPNLNSPAISTERVDLAEQRLII